MEKVRFKVDEGNGLLTAVMLWGICPTQDLAVNSERDREDFNVRGDSDIANGIPVTEWKSTVGTNRIVRMALKVVIENAVLKGSQDESMLQRVATVYPEGGGE